MTMGSMEGGVVKRSNSKRDGRRKKVKKAIGDYFLGILLSLFII